MALVPILLRPIGGRAGTTLVMQLLATSPLIAFDRVYPFERRYFLYFLNRARAMAPEEPRRRRPRRWQRAALRIADDLRRRADPRPHHNFEGQQPLPPEPEIFDVRTLVRLSFQRQWEAFSEAVIEKTAPPKPVYYAEKFLGGIERDLEPDPTKYLWLVRDPRDLWTSINAFDHKRGYYGFGRRKGQSRESFLHDFIGRMHVFAESELGRSEGELLVRYEDLVGDLSGEAARIEGWLDLELDTGPVFASREEMRRHMTSGSPEESVGRWRRDLPLEEQRLLTERLSGLLERYGYGP